MGESEGLINAFEWQITHLHERPSAGSFKAQGPPRSPGFSPLAATGLQPHSELPPLHGRTNVPLVKAVRKATIK